MSDMKKNATYSLGLQNNSYKKKIDKLMMGIEEPRRYRFL